MKRKIIKKGIFIYYQIKRNLENTVEFSEVYIIVRININVYKMIN